MKSSKLAGLERHRAKAQSRSAGGKYCQDNDLTWTDWTTQDDALVQAVADMAALRDRLGLARTGFALRNEIGWWHPDGRWMADGDWQDGGLCCLGLTLPAGEGGRAFLAVFNSGDDRAVTLPEGRWRRVLDTVATPVTRDRAEEGTVPIGWQSVAVWEAEPVEDAPAAR